MMVHLNELPEPGTREGFNCVDCGVNTSDIMEYYMVTDEVWVTQAHMDKHGGMLCIGCLEKRIVRVLVPADFTPAPINSCFSRSDRMLDRLGLAIKLRSDMTSS